MNFDELIELVSSDQSPGICVDSRAVRQGDIFVAVKGTACDGHDFIAQAVANGAKYVVCEKNTHYALRNTQYEQIVLDNTAEAPAILAQASNGHPASKLTNLAVTGTNGKTTVAFLVRSIVQQAGLKCGLIGTVIYDTCSGQSHEASLTTPDCLDIAARQAEMIRNGAEYMVIEASSHALSQSRLAQIDFKAAAFTNLAGDHLDYHKTEQDYLAAKTRLFSALAPDSTAVLNKQSPQADVIAGATAADILWYGIENRADLAAHIKSMDTGGTVFEVEYAGVSKTVRTSLVGLYNVSNCLAAAGLCLSVGFDVETVAAGLSVLEVIPGRLEKVEGGDFSVVIDYAHTDDALKNVLATLKPLCKGSLRVVFGCGGDRDKTKRPRMARVAERLADYVIVTSDNPRTEDPNAIIEDILAGFENRNSPAISVEPDRRKAIEQAIEAAGSDDIVLIAGKGHETYQVIGTQKFDFSDKEVAEECLAMIA
ncbi:MAG: UDP-N-acetylmuramoyl-L-alanyl-D-glutamate--2,6-diaminopimelate ligase [Phycisphaerales bacterium]|nr:MAG: UDP-N-acetylmuramoyl-L-alanyl-D-glutamate--2,6-diaminopimelate ligase [Phycisphaerales bacterium]